MANVIKRFRDKESKKVYEKGDSYHHKDENRIALLVKKGYVEKEESKEVNEIKHVGGGWYELPNGEKVKGKEQALESLESGE